MSTRRRRIFSKRLPPTPRRRRKSDLKDLQALVLDCAAHLLVQTGKCKTLPEGRNRAVDCLNTGLPRKKWDEMLAAQGADLGAFNRKLALDSTAGAVVTVHARKAGYISRCDARIIGEVIRQRRGKGRVEYR